MTEALNRAENGASTANYGAIYAGFEAKGISEDEILPRENVLTFNAWKARGRMVRKGEHGVKVMTYVSTKKKGAEQAQDGKEDKGRTIRRTTTVFHISQTKALQLATLRALRGLSVDS